MKPVVSVIIPAYNAEKTVEKCEHRAILIHWYVEFCFLYRDGNRG